MPAAGVQHSWLDRNGPLLAVGIAFFAGLAGLFNRGLSFHDEIINTNKGINGVVLDYAMRPAFYGLNVLAMKVFGNHSYALVMLSVVTLTLTALCLYYICKRYFSATIGLLCVVSYVGVSMVPVYGVRAMAHTHAGLFMVLSLYLALLCYESTDPWKQRAQGFASGVLAIVSFSTHPTMAGYLVALCTWAGITWLLSLFQATRSSALARPLRPSLWMAFGVIASFLFLAVVYAIGYHQGYFGAWFHFAGIPQGAESEKEISLFYVRSLLSTGGLSTKLLVGSILVVAALRIAARGRGDASGSAEQPFRAFVLAMPLYCLVVGMAMISLNQWKHERIVFSYVPLLALSFATWSATAYKRALQFQLRGPTIVRSVIRGGFLLLFVAVPVLSISRIAVVTAKGKARAPAVRHRYLSLYETLKNIPVDTIGVLAAGHLGTKISFVEAVPLSYVRIATPEQVSAMSAEAFIEKMLAAKTLYLYWDLESTTEDEYKAISKVFREAHGSLLENWRGFREVWKFEYRPTGEVQHAFSALMSGTRVAIFGEANELSTGTAFIIDLLVDRYRLHPYILNVNRRSARRELHYITANEADYVLMPLSADNRVSGDEIEAMVTVLKHVGAVVAGKSSTLQLWRIPDRARATSYAE